RPDALGALVLDARAASAGDAPPHDPVIGATLRLLLTESAGPEWSREHLPELLDPVAVERVAEPGPQTKTSQVVPTVQVLGRPRPLVRLFFQERPKTPAKAGGPIVAGCLQAGFQRPRQLVRTGR